MFFDGSLNISGAGAGILFVSPNKDKLRYVLRILFPASNNVTEYEACLHGIQLAVELGVKRLYVYGNSALVINQLNKEWDATHEKMDLYSKEIRKWETNFYGIEYIHVVRDKNQAADALSKLGSSRAQIPRGVFVQDIHEPSVGSGLVEKQPTETMLIDDATSTTSGRDWRTQFIKYISDGSGFQDKTENERLIRRSKNYILVDGKLMQKMQVPKYYSSAYHKMMASNSSMTYMPDPAATTPHPERWSEKLSEQDFIGQPRSMTPKNWSDTVRDVSSSLKGPTYLLTRFKLSHRPGLSPAGDST